MLNHTFMSLKPTILDSLSSTHEINWTEKRQMYQQSLFIKLDKIIRR